MSSSFLFLFSSAIELHSILHRFSHRPKLSTFSIQSSFRLPFAQQHSSILHLFDQTSSVLHRSCSITSSSPCLPLTLTTHLTLRLPSLSICHRSLATTLLLIVILTTACPHHLLKHRKASQLLVLPRTNPQLLRAATLEVRASTTLATAPLVSI